MPEPKRPQAKPLKRAPKTPPTATADQVRERSRGALVGLAVGEALGLPNEGRNLPAPDFPTLCDMELDVRGGGPHQLKRGETSWATQMAVCLALSVRNLRRYDLLETARAYARWVTVAPDAPEPVKQALALIADGRSPEATGRRVWLENAQRVHDNAPLARTAPLGVFYAAQRDERLRTTLEDTAITHFSPQCRIACATFNGIIGAAISAPAERIDQPAILKAAEAELSLAASTMGRAEPDWVQQVKDAADWLREDIKAAQDPDPMLYGPELHMFLHASHVRVAFRLALWELFHAPTFEAALQDVVGRGGDADTNAAITGALLGAVHGERSIPEHWREPVMEYAMGANDPLAPWHPGVLVTLVGTSPGDRE